MDNLEENMDCVDGEDDYGSIVGCALTDTLQEIISSLAGGYAILYADEALGVNPDKKKLSGWLKRREEIAALKRYFFGNDKSYNDIRRWIKVYGEELKEVNSLRNGYAHSA